MIDKRQILEYVFDRYFAWRLNQFTTGKYILLDYKFDPKPRYGYGSPPHKELANIFEVGRPAFSALIGGIVEHMESLFRIDQRGEPGVGEPTFHNPFYPGLDAAALYAMLAAEKPRRFIEVGSGYSTTFARRAIQDRALPTQIVSIDPHPRVEIEALCDKSFRTPLENMVLDLFSDLGPGDFLFIDNSHRCFTNTDVTVFFMEVLPRLKPGVVLHLHDIFLPYDYPPQWSERYYSEQYLLACWLMARSNHLDLLFSSPFVSRDPMLSEMLSPFWNSPLFHEGRSYAESIIHGYKGTALWARVNNGSTSRHQSDR